MPGYLTKQETVAVPGVADLQIRSLLDRQQYSDPEGAAERAGISSAMWPIFGLLWPAGSYLAGRLAARPVRAGERILEVGCGLALASLVAHRRGADITASDLHPLAGAFLQENLRLNGLPPMKYRTGDWSSHTDTAAGTTAAAGAAAASESVVDGLTGPVHTGAAPAGFDLIIGSDVLYQRDTSRSLAAFIHRHAPSDAASEVWIVDPNRGHRAAFARHMQDQGYAQSDERFVGAATATQPAWRGHWLVYRRG